MPTMSETPATDGVPSLLDRSFRDVVVSERARKFLMLAAIALSGFWLIVFFHTGFYAAWDDAQYMLGAYKIASGLPDVIPDTFKLAAYRLGMTAPMAAVYWLADGSVEWVTRFFWGYGVGLILTTFLIGRRIHGTQVGLTAAAVVAASPLVYVFGGAILPDQALAFWTSISVLALVYAAPGERADSAIRWRRAILLTVFAGLAFGLAYTVKISGAIMAVPLGGVVLLTAPRMLSVGTFVRLIAFGIGALTVVGAEQIALFLLEGSWQSRLSIVGGYSEYYRETALRRESLDFAHRTIYAAVQLAKLMPATFPLFCASLAAYPFVKSRSLAVWFLAVWPVLYLTFGTTSFTTYAPPTINARYYTVALPYAAIAFAFFGLHIIRLISQRLSVSSWGKGNAGVESSVRSASILLLGCVLLGELFFNLPAARNLYDAKWVSTFRATYTGALGTHRDLPIVIGPVAGKYMGPFLFGDRPDRVHVHSVEYGLFDQALPAPPFVLVESFAVLEPAYRQRDRCWTGTYFEDELTEFLSEFTQQHASLDRVRLTPILATYSTASEPVCTKMRRAVAQVLVEDAATQPLAHTLALDPPRYYSDIVATADVERMKNELAPPLFRTPRPESEPIPGIVKEIVWSRATERLVPVSVSPGPPGPSVQGQNAPQATADRNDDEDRRFEAAPSAQRNTGKVQESQDGPSPATLGEEKTAVEQLGTSEEDTSLSRRIYVAIRDAAPHKVRRAFNRLVITTRESVGYVHSAVDRIGIAGGLISDAVANPIASSYNALAILFTYLISSLIVFLCYAKLSKLSDDSQPLYFLLSLGLGPSVIALAVTFLMAWFPGRHAGFYVGGVLGLFGVAAVYVHTELHRVTGLVNRLGEYMRWLVREGGWLAVFLIALLSYLLVSVASGATLAPIFASDPSEYALNARIVYEQRNATIYPFDPIADAASGHYAPSSHPFGFMGLMVWLHLLQGSGDQTDFVKSISSVFALYLVLLVWGLMSRRDALTGLVAAVCVIAAPLFFTHVVSNHIDAFRVFTFTAALFWGWQLAKKPGKATLVFAAAALGAAIFSHSLGIIALFLFSAIYLWFDKRALRQTVPGVVAACVLATALFGQQYFSNVFEFGLPVDNGTAHAIQSMEDLHYVDYLNGIHDIAEPARRLSFGLLKTITEFWHYGIVFVAALIYLAALRRRVPGDEVLGISLFIVITYHVIIFLSSLLGDFALRNIRYPLTVLPFAAIIAGATLSWFLSSIASTEQALRSRFRVLLPVGLTPLASTPTEMMTVSTAISKIRSVRLCDLAFAAFLALVALMPLKTVTMGLGVLEYFELTADNIHVSDSEKIFGVADKYDVWEIAKQVAEETPADVTVLGFAESQFHYLTGRRNLHHLDPRMMEAYQMSSLADLSVFLRDQDVGYIIARTDNDGRWTHPTVANTLFSRYLSSDEFVERVDRWDGGNAHGWGLYRVIP